VSFDLLYLFVLSRSVAISDLCGIKKSTLKKAAHCPIMSIGREGATQGETFEKGCGFESPNATWVIPKNQLRPLNRTQQEAVVAM